MRIGLLLSSEEFGPRELVELAVRAERAGFAGLWISDHFHPWNDQQGHSPFVWSVIGAIARATDLPVGTGVTCPTIRIHPAIRRLWTGEVVDHRGRHYTVQSARIYDLPEAPPLVLVCYGPDEAAARRTAHRLWPNNGLPGELAQVLPTVAHFEQASQLVPEDAMDAMPLAPDLDRHHEGLKEFADAGVDELYVQQIGPDQDAFFDTWAQEILPRFHDG